MFLDSNYCGKRHQWNWRPEGNNKIIAIAIYSHHHNHDVILLTTDAVNALPTVGQPGWYLTGWLCCPARILEVSHYFVNIQTNILFPCLSPWIIWIVRPKELIWIENQGVPHRPHPESCSTPWLTIWLRLTFPLDTLPLSRIAMMKSIKSMSKIGEQQYHLLVCQTHMMINHWNSSHLFE